MEMHPSANILFFPFPTSSWRVTLPPAPMAMRPSANILFLWVGFTRNF
jgi:hypothetical protein